MGKNDNEDNIKENRQENEIHSDECNRIISEYTLEEAERFIVEIMEKNDYRQYVDKEVYYCVLKQENIEEKVKNDFLKYLIINDFIKIYYDNSKTFCSSNISDEYLINYVEDLYNSGKKWYIKLYTNDLAINALKKISKLKEETEKLKEETMHLTEKVKDSMKDILSIMAFFVSLVALISINMEFLKDTTGFKILIVNLSLILSISFIFFFITLILKKNNSTDEKKRDDKTINIISIIIVILSIVLCGICILDWHYSTNSYTSKEENSILNITNFNFD